MLAAGDDFETILEGYPVAGTMPTFKPVGRSQCRARQRSRRRRMFDVKSALVLSQNHPSVRRSPWRGRCWPMDSQKSKPQAGNEDGPRELGGCKSDA